MNSEIKSETNYNGNVIPQVDWIRESYSYNMQDGPKKEPQQLPDLRHQKISRKPVVHPKEREAEKKAAKAVTKANKTDLNKRNIK